MRSSGLPWLDPDGQPVADILEATVDELELTTRCFNCFQHMDEPVRTVGDLVRWPRGRLLRLPNFGRKSLAVVEEALAVEGLRLGMSDQPDEPPPWSAEHRRWVKARIDDAAARMREVLGAHDVLVVAWFQDIAKPEFLHVQDGGTAPLPPDEVYRYMMQTVRVRQAVEAGKTVLELTGDGTGSSTVQ